MVPPLKGNHPAVFVSNPLKYGPGGASAATHTTAKSAIAKTVVARRLSFWKLKGSVPIRTCFMTVASVDCGMDCVR
jgi:hypothetical protein